ncbi:MAG: hypothetical protein ACI8Z5_002733 [Lentimonas sp.]|jgi:hypothetical protein
MFKYLLTFCLFMLWQILLLSAAVQPNTRLYLNENRVVSDTDPEVRSKKMVLYMKEVVKLLKQDAPLTGPGLQSRFHAMTPPLFVGRLQTLDDRDRI